MAAAGAATLEGCASHHRRIWHRAAPSASSASASTSISFSRVLPLSAIQTHGNDGNSDCSGSHCLCLFSRAASSRLRSAGVSPCCRFRLSAHRQGRVSSKAWKQFAALLLADGLRHGQAGKGNSRRSGRLPVLSSSSLAESDAEVWDGQVEMIEDDVDVELITEWELDFCSRPIVDTRGKKIWELLVCDSERSLQFARYFPNNVINSGTLRDALAYIIDNLGVPKPQKVRFFRSQMQTIIGKACAELEIKAVPSRRCYQLYEWLEERFQAVYSQHPGYREGSGPLTLLEQPIPIEVPENFRGEQWAFVQLPLSAVQDEVEAVIRGDNFGSVFSLEATGLDLPSDALIPGLAVASKRALPLAARTNALELASLDSEAGRSRLILSSGVSERWTYASWRQGAEADEEAAAWERAKSKVGGVHFLALQESLDSELCAGFWLMTTPPKSPV